MKKRWAYVFTCPVCTKPVRVAADRGVTRDTPAVPFYSACPNCRSQIEFRSDQLREIETSEGRMLPKGVAIWRETT